MERERRKRSGATTQPAYLTIAAALRERIESGHLVPHAAVPSERELSQTFGVSRMTARAAVARLQSEGYVYRRPPRGTFVAEPRIPLRIGSFSDEIARTGRLPGAEVIWAETVEPTPLVREALGLRTGARVHGIQRLRRANGEPIAIETSYLAEELCPDLLEGPLTGSLWRALGERAGIEPARAEARIEAVVTDAEEARWLEVKTGDPAVMLIRHTYDADDRCFEVARDVYRADRAELLVETRIPPMTRDGQVNAGAD